MTRGRTMPSTKRLVARAAAVIVAALALTGGVAAAQSGSPTSLRNRLGFTPLGDTPQSCSATSIRWSPDVTATKVMQRGDAATLLGGGAATVPGENDMIASDPSGQFVFTVSETGSGGALTRLHPATGEQVIIAPPPERDRLDPVNCHA